MTTDRVNSNQVINADTCMHTCDTFEFMQLMKFDNTQKMLVPACIYLHTKSDIQRLMD